MKKRKNTTVILLIVLFLITGCGNRLTNNPEKNSNPQPETTAQTEFEKPQAYGVLSPEYLLKGLSVHGSGSLVAGEQMVLAEIDLDDLKKIQQGAAVNLLNHSKDINLQGELVKLPQETSDCIDGICELEIFLDEPAKISGGVEAAIQLPINEGVFYINKECVLEGADGETYVWVSLKKPQEIKPADWELRQIKLGETDGKRFEVLEGLNGDESLAMMF